jgi:hypothetical protein
MHPFITQSIAAGRVRDLRQAAARHRDASLARARRPHQRQAARPPGTIRLPRAPRWRLYL